MRIFGLNDKVFKRKRYYNDKTFQNPYIIEDVLGEDIEPIYNRIMSEINEEDNLSKSIRSDIMLWLYISKMRSPSMRDIAYQMISFSSKAAKKYVDRSISKEQEDDIERYAQKLAKDIHLNTFTNKDQAHSLLKLFIETLNTKHWQILKSTSAFEFWTNDNPGFSPNVDERFVEVTPYHHILELNTDSVILFPLSPKYCLEITPFKVGTLLDTCALTMNIKFEQASLEYIDYINRGVFYTRSNLVVSNRIETLEHCIRYK